MITQLSNELPTLEIDTHPEITAALLTCIAAGYKHLLIRTPEDGIGRVKSLVTNTLSALTAPLIQRIRAKEHHTPLSFLRSILISQSGHNPEHSFVSTIHGAHHTKPHSPVRSKHRAVSPISPPTSPSRPSSYPNVQSLELTQLRPSNQLRPVSLPPRRKPSAIRVPNALVVSHLEVASRAVQQTFVDVLKSRIIIIDSDADDYGDTNIGVGRWNLPDDFLLVYVHSGGRDDRERSPIIKPLIDVFGYSMTIVLTDQDLSYGGSQHHLMYSSMLSKENIHHMLKAAKEMRLPLPLQVYAASLISAARNHHQLDGSFLTLRAQRDFETLLKASTVVSRVLDASTEYGPTAVDAAKLFIRVVTHRLRVRNGPQDEALGPLLWDDEDERGARSLPSLGLETLEHSRRSICDIIVEDILTAV
ncbi:hypothetical protein RhiXN_06650 [Rhizoctonia solani]|uniref:Uncharacterized protein n=1 Tax=Rhizoctonia solani TaxID=456999 RepID=A0A8H8NX02_9AGAM|nr:uncharacterized protein RhiXN_06650 [Rhizoctonia solani]QRW21661.1 hypothetical protein RhiXN_06650 [Rhizoctonia solani]